MSWPGGTEGPGAGWVKSLDGMDSTCGPYFTHPWSNSSFPSQIAWLRLGMKFCKLLHF